VRVERKSDEYGRKSGGHERKSGGSYPPDMESMEEESMERFESVGTKFEPPSESG
jgi:hypothetical protein